MKCRTCYWLAVFACIAAMVIGAQANGRYGGAKPGKINDVPRTVRRDEAAIRFAESTAEEWDIQDSAACQENSFTETWRSYARCMVLRSNTRVLYMLRQNCVGLNASVCKEKLQ